MTRWPLRTWISKYDEPDVVLVLVWRVTLDGARSFEIECCRRVWGSGVLIVTRAVGECRMNATYMAVHTGPLLGRHLWLKTSEHGQAPVS